MCQIVLCVPNLDRKQAHLSTDIYVFLTDPPAVVNITVSIDVEEVNLNQSFREYTFEASAEPYAGISCSSVVITWTSPTKGIFKSCKAEGK